MTTLETTSKRTPDFLGISGILRKKFGPLTVFESSFGEEAGKEKKTSYVFSLPVLVDALNPVIEQFGCFAKYELDYRRAKTNPNRVVTTDKIKILPQTTSARMNFQKALADIQRALESGEGKELVERGLEKHGSNHWFEEAQNAFLTVRTSLGEAIR